MEVDNLRGRTEAEVALHIASDDLLLHQPQQDQLVRPARDRVPLAFVQGQQLLRLELHANLLPPTTRLQRNGAATHTGGAVAAAPNNARVVHRFAVAPVLEPRGLKKIIIALLARSYHDNGTAQQSRRVAVAQRWKELRRPWPIVHGRCKRLDGYRSHFGDEERSGILDVVRKMKRPNGGF